MLGQAEYLAVVKPQSFPDGVTALHHRIKHTDASFIAMKKFAVDVDLDVFVSRIVFLKHGSEQLEVSSVSC